MAVKIQARELVRVAKKNKKRIFRGGRMGCALGMTARMVGLSPFATISEIAVATGRSAADLSALEDGFEGWCGDDPYPSKKNRYFKVGERLAKLAGLS